MRNRFLKFPIILVPGFIIFLLASFFYFFLVWRVSSTLTEQILYREELAAKAGSNSISIFIENLGFQLSIFASRPSIVTPNPQDTPHALKTLFEGMYSTPITGAILADSQGIVLYGFEKPGSLAGGEDISDREYFKWAQTAKNGEVYVGSPIISKVGFSNGRYIVPLATPVIKDGQFNGVLVTAFFIDELAAKYLDELKITGNTRIYVIGKDGIVISSPVEKLLGLNYFDYLKKSNLDGINKAIGKLQSALTSDTAGTIDLFLPNETKNGTIPTRFLVGYAPVEIKDSRWLLAIATPSTDTLASLYPLYFRDLGIIGMVALVSIVIAFYLDKMLGIIGKGPRGEKSKTTE